MTGTRKTSGGVMARELIIRLKLSRSIRPSRMLLPTMGRFHHRCKCHSIHPIDHLLGIYNKSRDISLRLVFLEPQPQAGDHTRPAPPAPNITFILWESGER